MKIDLFDVTEFIDLNKLQEVKSGRLLQRGDIPDPEGLVSNEIFGVTTKSRKETMAYIDLHGHFFHPHIFKAIRRMFRNIDKIVNGESYYSINSEGHLVLDDNGDTGIDFLYRNWEKIKWDDKNQTVGMRYERSNLITKCKKDEIFMPDQLVIPAFYRDVKTGEGGGSKTDDVNNMYSRLIRLCSVIKNQSMFGFQLHATNYNIQLILVEIYDFYKHKLEKKNGIIRKYLMGKNVDYCTRTVITGPTYHADTIDDLFVDFKHSTIPIAQICSLAYPFMMYYLKNFFENEVIDRVNGISLYDSVTDTVIKDLKIIDPEIQFSEKYIKKMLDTFIKDQESRFNKIEVQTNYTKGKVYLTFTGQRMDASNKSEVSGIASRPMTWTDLLYMAAVDVTKNKHCIITRYPINDEFNLIINKIRVASTTKTCPMLVNGILYKWYPIIDFSVPAYRIGSLFIDSTSFSNAYLEGIDGDYDGDQTTVKIAFTQEANEELEAILNKKANFVNTSGSNIRSISKECLQTFYVLTKDPYGEYRALTNIEKNYFLNLKNEDLTFQNFVSWFGNTVDISDNDKHKAAVHSKFNPCDTLTINPGEYKIYHGKEPLKTTLGRLIFNKVIIESLGFESILEYQNNVLTKKGYGAVDGAIIGALKDDKISVDQMCKFIDTRDWFGLQLHGVITSSFTRGVCILPDSVKALKKKLFEENKDAIANGDEVVIEKIEKQLIELTKKELKDDIGMDLYMSGARGSVDNHLKNIMLTRGAVSNPVTGKYDIIENSLMDGLQKKDITPHANTIITGSYPKAVGTAVSGYLAKELLAILQGEVLAEEGSDCGSLRTIIVNITASNFKDYIYRYVKTSKGWVSITNENRDMFIGKTVQMRTPMYCVGIGKEKCICNKCAGDFYYKLGKKNIGLVGSKVATTLTQLNLQKFHENLVKTQQLDVDDLFI